MIPLLEPLFQGEMRSYGESLACAPQFPPSALAVARLLSEPELLTRQLRASAARLGQQDLRPVASNWSNRYLGALLPPLVAGATLLRHRFPANAKEMAVSLAPHGEVTGFHILALGESLPEADAEERYDALLRGHLAPLFAQLSRQSGLAQKILWGNAVRWLNFLFDAAQGLAAAHGEQHVAAVMADRAHLIDSALWAGEENPLYMRRRRAPAKPGEKADADGLIALHSQCCLYHLLPGQGYCGACPLDPVRVRSQELIAAD
ncbi:siderophore-iron reductase FhuF [Pseudoduganella violacea]|uniref:Ferric iron reductase protein FhuF n=1 Tax=Pseudoduganella violacea TaxID=1715466 RepID=A0A7W5BCY7_9BURK|nr:siderophore-iron reductase FhuF [Pseudoduganella violacea]MBB3120927.1 ferric iron reductase protein FhuF [Pseudoduganella violacea]